MPSLTPIRVRGKRYDQGPNAKSKSASSSGSSTPTRVMELGSSRAVEKEVPQSKRPRTSKTLTTRKKPSKIAPKLEELPVEILQQIFSYCLEISLPRASPFLGKVFGKRDCENVTIQAFSKPSTHYQLDKYRATECDLSHQEWEEVRTQIITCRWFTPAFFKHCSFLYLKQMVHVQSQWSRLSGEEFQPMLSRVRNFRDEDADAQLDETADLSGDPVRSYTMLRWTYSSGKCMSLKSRPRPREWVTRWQFPHFPTKSTQETICYVPRVLCRRPFTPSKIEKLKFLRVIYEEIGPDSTELFSLGVREAIAANSLEVLCALLNLGSHSRKWKKPALDSQHFIVGTLRNWQFLALLVEYDNGDEMPKDDPSLTAWALEAAQNTDFQVAALGKRVLRIMALPRKKIGNRIQETASSGFVSW